ncbi:MAG TPA: hypothetical protein PKA53_07610, partial [Sphingobacterium sp.]|nr:hypothetical protein [Sphingobacterium sp.]
MKKLAVLLVFIVVANNFARSQVTATALPDSIYTGNQGTFHVQGVAVDHDNGHVYFSFTNKLIKTDLDGKLIGSVTGFVGHLGDLDFNTDDGKVYGSLEYKNDAIGKGINKTLGVEARAQNGFYIAIFDGSKIVRPDMDAETEDVLTTVHLQEPVNDYEATVKMGSEEIKHRFACSGIDGVAIGPAFGKPNSKKKYLYVAYGIYGDKNRTDNDHQIILKYDIRKWSRFYENLSQGELHRSGPKKPLKKYFVKTGNTRWGVQSLAYDSYTGHFFAAVYRGSKPIYPNYDLFVMDGHKKAKTTYVQSDNKNIKVKGLSLLEAGSKDNASGIRGWHFKWG